MDRERKHDPHRCAGCGTAFDVTYFDDRQDARCDAPPTLTEVGCPRCGRKLSVSLPAGAERTVLVEPGAEVEIGGSG